MTEYPSDVGWYYLVVHDTRSVDDCAEILRSLMGGSVDAWVDALNASEKHRDGEVGRAGGIIFIRSTGPRWLA